MYSSYRSRTLHSPCNYILCKVGLHFSLLNLLMEKQKGGVESRSKEWSQSLKFLGNRVVNLGEVFYEVPEIIGGNVYILQFYFIRSNKTLACKKFKMTQYDKNSREWTEKLKRR